VGAEGGAPRGAVLCLLQFALLLPRPAGARPVRACKPWARVAWTQRAGAASRLRGWGAAVLRVQQLLLFRPTALPPRWRRGPARWASRCAWSEAYASPPFSRRQKGEAPHHLRSRLRRRAVRIMGVWFFGYVVVKHPDHSELARARTAFVKKKLFLEFSQRLIPAGVDRDDWCMNHNPIRDDRGEEDDDILLSDLPGREFSFKVVTKNSPPTHLWKAMHEDGFEVNAWHVSEDYEHLARFTGGELIKDYCDQNTFLQLDAWKDPRAIVALAAVEQCF